MIPLQINMFIYKFLFVLSFVYTLRYLFELIIKLILPNSEQMKVTKVEGLFIYLAIAYIITFLIT